MTKTKQKQKSNWNRGPLPSTDPIYQSGRILLRPVHGPKPSDEPPGSTESSDSTDTDQESSEYAS